MSKIPLERAERIAEAVVRRLSPFCKKIEIVGSIRRQRPWVRDIDIVLAPGDLWNLHGELMRMGQMKMKGEKLLRLVVKGVQVDIYVADEENWATLLLIRTGSAEHNIRLASLAKKRGWHLHANGDGLFDEKGRKVAGETEESIFAALGLRYLLPEQREITLFK